MVPVSYTHLDVYKRQVCYLTHHHHHHYQGLNQGWFVPVSNRQRLELVTPALPRTSHTSPSPRLIVPQLFGDSAVINSAKLFPPVQPILDNPVEYTHNVQVLPYVCVSSMIMESIPCMRNLISAVWMRLAWPFVKEMCIRDRYKLPYK